MHNVRMGEVSLDEYFPSQNWHHHLSNKLKVLVFLLSSFNSYSIHIPREKAMLHFILFSRTNPGMLDPSIDLVLDELIRASYLFTFKIRVSRSE